MPQRSKEPPGNKEYISTDSVSVNFPFIFHTKTINFMTLLDSKLLSVNWLLLKSNLFEIIKGKYDCMNFTCVFFTALDRDLTPVEGDWIEEGHKTSLITTQTQIITGIYCVLLCTTLIGCKLIMFFFYSVSNMSD